MIMIDMHIFWLALIQGLTEFLPVSSSGHLILFAKYTNFGDQGQHIDIALHVGSLIAVVLYFYKTIKKMIIALFKHNFMPKFNIEGVRLAYYLLFATIPAIIIGGALSYFGTSWTRSTQIIGYSLIFYSLLLWYADSHFSTSKTLKNMRFYEAILIGLAQCLAFLPGTSRSGITITMGRFLGFNRSEVAKFSMLLSVPSIFGAGVLAISTLLKKDQISLMIDAYEAIGFSFVFSFLAIFLMMQWLRFATFLPFVIYRIILGVALLLDAYGVI